MGKNLKGRELGKGLSQRKDGKYSARFTGKNTKRIEKYFDKLSDAKKWLATIKEEDLTVTNDYISDITVDKWFDYWINNIKLNTVRPSTLAHYNDRYKYNIKPILGDMPIKDVKPMHCQKVLNGMGSNGYAMASMTQTRITMFTLFSAAVENDIVIKNPVTKSVKTPKGKKSDVHVLTMAEQEQFLDVAKGSSYYREYLFILNTGIRVGELIGLQWEDVDFENRVININRSIKHHTQSEYIVGEPKSASGYRSIPLTDMAYDILVEIKNERKSLLIENEKFRNIVFLNKNGLPTTNIVYNNNLKKFCKRANIHQISVHTLRHTFATRCIEADMRPKTLQQILGHSDISTTMNLYVHVTEDSKEKEILKFEKYLKLA